MTRLTWDDSVSYPEYGVSHGVLYFLPGTAVPWNGLIQIEENTTPPSLDPLYFDGSVINLNRAPNPFKAKITAFSFPERLEDSIVTDPSGDSFFVDGKRVQPAHFTYRTKSTKGDKIHIVYNCVFRILNVDSETLTEDTSVSPFVFEVTALPVSYGTNIYPYNGNRYNTPNPDLAPPPPGSDPSAWEDYLKNRYTPENPSYDLPPFIYDPSLGNPDFPSFEDHLDLDGLFPTPHFEFPEWELPLEDWLKLEDWLYGGLDFEPQFPSPQLVFDELLGPNPALLTGAFSEGGLLSVGSFLPNGTYYWHDICKLSDTRVVVAFETDTGDPDWNDAIQFVLLDVSGNTPIVLDTTMLSDPNIGGLEFNEGAHLTQIASTKILLDVYVESAPGDYNWLILEASGDTLSYSIYENTSYPANANGRSQCASPNEAVNGNYMVRTLRTREFTTYYSYLQLFDISTSPPTLLTSQSITTPGWVVWDRPNENGFLHLYEPNFSPPSYSVYTVTGSSMTLNTTNPLADPTTVYLMQDSRQATAPVCVVPSGIYAGYVMWAVKDWNENLERLYVIDREAGVVNLGVGIGDHPDDWDFTPNWMSSLAPASSGGILWGSTTSLGDNPYEIHDIAFVNGSLVSDIHRLMPKLPSSGWYSDFSAVGIGSNRWLVGRMATFQFGADAGDFRILTWS